MRRCCTPAACLVSVLAVLASPARAAFAQSVADCGAPPAGQPAQSAGGQSEIYRHFDSNGNGLIDAGCELQWLQAHANEQLGGPKSAEESFPGEFRAALDKITAYEPIYFLAGNDDELGINGKFQLSLDYRLFRSAFDLGRLSLPIHNLHFSYTQTSFWDFSEKSEPFRDSSYRPRLYYRFEGLWKGFGNRVLADVDVGVAHESNGRDGEQSRSLHQLFLRPTFTYGTGSPVTGRDGTNLWYLRPTMYGYLDDDENPDIRHYRGHVDLELGYIWHPDIGRKRDGDPWRAWVTLRKGEKSDYGSLEANVAAALGTFFPARLNGWFMLQYFTGYGESLLDYNARADSQLRAGLAIVF